MALFGLFPPRWLYSSRGSGSQWPQLALPWRLRGGHSAGHPPMNLSCAAARPLPSALFGIAAFLASALGASGAAAEGQNTLRACVERAVNAARSQGARPSGPPVVDFMLTGDERTYEYALPENGCLGLLAVGHRQVQHLGLALLAPSGRLLAQDDARSAHPYARFCGPAGRKLVVDVRMLDGEGEFHLVPLWNAPASLDALETIMGSCMSTGDPRPDLIDVGPEPLGPPIDVELSALSKRLAGLGYRRGGGVLAGGLPERQREVRRVMLEGGQCYALAGVGDGDVEDIDMRLLSISDTTALVASDVTRQRDAVLKVCPERPGVFVLDVRMYRGAGSYVVQSYGLSEPPGPRPPGVEGGTRIPYAELTAQLAERGMRTTPVAWGLLQPEGVQAVPLHLRAGRCYAVSALAAPEFAGGDMDMSLVDEEGRLFASEIGPSPHPLVFHCAERDTLARAVVQAHEIRRPARFLLVLGEPHEEPQVGAAP